MSRKHHSKSKKLNRDFNQRKALIRQQLNALITNGYLVTTETKAKLIKSIFDKTASDAKTDSLHRTRQIISKLNNVKSAYKLAKVISPSMANRQGGFTKITKLGSRRGDNAPLAKLELTVPLPKAEPKPKAEKGKEKKETKKIESKTVKTTKKINEK